MLNACPKCQRTFPVEAGSFCPEDATKLEPIEKVPVPHDANDPFVGHKVAGKYEIRRVVADGGMGRVYEARILDGDKRVACKILHAEIAEDSVNIERFRREAETSRSLDHGHIVDVIDFNEEKPAPGRKDGAWYLVMEYLDGDELRTLLGRQKILPMGRIIRIMSQTAIALDGAHAQGAVHRDLKPDNIFLVRGKDGDQVKVLDFGSVKFTKGQDRGQKLTVMGTTIGSPFYMSPEQATGVPDLDQRADVWALGAIIYECAVGQVPFTASNGPQILFKILGEEPMPPSFANDSVAPQLDDFMVKALHKKREQRYQSCGELADALGHAFGLQGTHLDWAQTPEAELTAKASASSAHATPMAAPAPAPTAAPMTPMAFPMAARPAQQPQPQRAAPTGAGDVVPLDYSPVKKVPVGIYLTIIVLIVILGGLVAFIAMR